MYICICMYAHTRRYAHICKCKSIHAGMYIYRYVHVVYVNIRISIYKYTCIS